MASSSAQVAAAQATLARNLLSSVLALAFPDNLISDADAQCDFLAQLPQLHALLTQHNVFDVVVDGKAFDKFLARLFELIDTAQGVDRAVKAAAFELLLVVVEQCPLDALEAIVPKLTERILKMVKYIKDAPLVVARASDVARVLVRHVELYSPESRRDFHDWVSKLLPASAAVLGELVAKTAALTQEDVVLFASVTGVFTELLEVSPSAVRSTLNKLEAAVAALVLYKSPISADATAVATAAQCLAAISNASDKSHQLWKQIVDKAIEMAHQLVDPLAGKRLVTAPEPTGLKVWLRENGGSSGASDLEALAVYERVEALLRRLNAVVLVLEESVKNRSISEREVQLVMNDIITLTRRVVTVRAHEVGKQSAISEDGFRLPASVVYGALPQIHALGLRCLNALVSRAGLCGLRHASKIAKVLVLASENVQSESHAALYDAVATCVRVLGASTLEKIGQPLLDHLVAQCKQDLLDDDKAKKNDVDDAKAVITDGKGKGGKGKKRKRQIGDLSQLAADAGAGNGALFLSARNQRVLVGNVDAALAAIATCVVVYGGLLPADTRSLASEVALLAVQQQVKRRAMRVAAAPRHGVDSIAMLLLTDAVTADANSAHATNLVRSVDYWSSPSCASSLAQLLALNTSEALVHPRGPPLSLNFDNAIQAHTAPPAANSGFLSRSNGGGIVPAAAAVRGRLDWEREEQQQHAVSEPEDEDRVKEKISKRAKVAEEQADTPMEESTAVEEEADEEEAEDDEDYDDERPVAVESSGDNAAEGEDEDDDNDDDDEAPAPAATSTSSTVAVAGADDDGDDDEFPDIVVDDDDDE